MKQKILSILTILCVTITINAQQRTIPTDTTVVTNHTTTKKLIIQLILELNLFGIMKEMQKQPYFTPITKEQIM